jgi:hypothetical protein
VNNTVVKLGLYPHIHRVLQRRWRLQWIQITNKFCNVSKLLH